MPDESIKHFLLKYDNDFLGQLSFYFDKAICYAFLRPTNSQYFDSSKIRYEIIQEDEDIEKLKGIFLDRFCSKHQKFERNKIQICLHNEILKVSIIRVIEYLDWNYTPRRANILETYVGEKPFYDTHDPEWHIHEVGNREWLEYISGGNERWKCKVHCSFNPGGNWIEWYLEHVNQSNSGNHDDNKIHFLDHQRQAWWGDCVDVPYPFPRQPWLWIRK